MLCALSTVLATLKAEKEENIGFQRRTQKLLDMLMIRKDGYSKLITTLEAIGHGDGDAVRILKEGLAAHEEEVAAEEYRQQTAARNERLRAQRETARLAVAQENSPNLDKLERDILDYISGKKEVTVEIRHKSLVVSGGDAKYKLTPNGKRYVLVLNVLEFESERKNRFEGGKMDNKNLKEVFEGLGFKVFFGCPNNPDRIWFEPDDFHKAIEKFRKKCEEDRVELCVVFVGSHGDQDNVFCSDWQPIHVMRDVVYGFGKWKSNLEGVPKIFIIQSCQDFPTGGGGGQSQSGPSISVYSRETQPISNPEINDACVMKAALPGGPSFRDEVRGSWLVNALTCVLMKFAGTTSFQDMFKVVQKLVSKFPDEGTGFDLFESAQLPTYLDIGLDKLYLVPKLS